MRECSQQALKRCFETSAIRRAVVIASIVGPVLTLINQWEACLSGVGFNWTKAGLSLAVPFTVSLCSCFLMMRNQLCDRQPAAGSD